MFVMAMKDLLSDVTRKPDISCIKEKGKRKKRRENPRWVKGGEIQPRRL
jgi:hypothetical protein